MGVEAIGQFVKKTNEYFKQKKINGKVHHESLMDLKKIEKIVKQTKTPRVVFLFKVVDSLESLERNYSKKLILNLKKYVNRFVISFPTKSMVKRQKIWAKRTWFSKFVKSNFDLMDVFELGDEKYFIFQKKEKK